MILTSSIVVERCTRMRMVCPDGLTRNLGANRVPESGREGNSGAGRACSADSTQGAKR